MKYGVSTANERGWRTTKLAKLSLNHAIGRTLGWRFFFYSKKSNNHKKHKIKCPGCLLNFLKILISRLRDPPRGPYFVCCTVKILNLSCLCCVAKNMSKNNTTFLHVPKLRANPEYSTRQMLRISYFWPSWNSYVRLGVFHTFLSTKRSHFYFSPKICLKFLIIRLLTSLAICSTTCTILIWAQLSYCCHTAVILLSDLDFVALNNQHIRWYCWCDIKPLLK